MRRVGTLCAALAALALLVGACGRDQPPTVGTTVIAPADRQSLPAISGTTVDGTHLDLASLRGKVVVLNNWASWCEPCRTEVPTLVTLAAKADPKAVLVVGLDVSDDHEAASAFEQDFAMTYPSIRDADGTLLRSIPDVPPAALPSTVIVDRQGRIAVRIIGPVDPSTLPGYVAQVASERP